MKTLLIIGLLLISVSAESQIYLLVDPGLFRAGAMYNQYMPNHKTGVYVRGLYGVNNWEMFDGTFHTQCVKLGTGVSFRFREGGSLYFGLNYSHYFDIQDNTMQIDLNRIKPVSIDIGICSSDLNRFRILFITDPLNWETAVGFTFRFKKTPRSRIESY